MTTAWDPARASERFADSWRSERHWEHALAELSIQQPDAVHKSVYDPTTRIYLHSDRAYKITIKVEPPPLHRKQSQGGLEAEILGHCRGISRVPTAIEYAETTTAWSLAMNRIRGLNLESLSPGLTARETVVALSSLFATIVAISLRGIAHNDIVPRNVLMDDNGRVFLTDFDQAHRAGRTAALARNILGIRMQKPPVYGSWVSMVMRAGATLVPWRSGVRAPALPPDATDVQKKLYSAWDTARRSDANAPGKRLAYYSLSIGGLELPGERPWEERWQMLRGAVDFTNLRTLELGCNMGLLSCWLLKESRLASAVGVDADPLILSSAQQVADAYGVAASYELVDLDSVESWEDRFSASDFDLAFALNVLNWVSDKDRLLRFLSRFPVVVFEGHDTDEIEIDRFVRVGFSRHVILGKSERERTVFVFSR